MIKISQVNSTHYKNVTCILERMKYVGKDFFLQCLIYKVRLLKRC